MHALWLYAWARAWSATMCPKFKLQMAWERTSQQLLSRNDQRWQCRDQARDPASEIRYHVFVPRHHNRYVSVPNARDDGPARVGSVDGTV